MPLSFGQQPSWRPSRWLAALAQTLLLSSAWLPASRADKSAADYFVHSLPGAPDGPLLKMHAGHIEVTPEHHGHLFFWHFQNRHIANRQRTVIWLNGGPGCSSMDGALMEVGPYRVVEGGKLTYNEGSWDEFANVLFVDNPVGTGFSYVDTDSYVHELDDMASQFVTFLERWFDLFPEYAQDDIYIAGESYAGQHIPYVARAMFDRNHNTMKEPWNLKGLLIGNGWTSPVDQYLAYLPYAYKHNVLQPGSDGANTVEKQQAICNKALDEAGKEHVDTGVCEDVLQEILRASQRDGNCVNMYDVRLQDTYPSCGMNWPPDLKHVTPYLRRQEVVLALNVNPDKRTGWTECNGAVGSNFRARNSRPAIELLPDLLESVPIIFFSGDQDLICNHMGTEELINNLEWNGAKGFELSPGTWAPRREWTFEGQPAGQYQSARNLTYVLFYNSSHMVPFDYPRRTRDMLDRFMDVDIASIGGEPADSRIDGAEGPQTSVGGHPNSTAAKQAEQDRVKAAMWRAYYKSGEVALVIVLIAAVAWGIYIWRSRRSRRGRYGSLDDDDVPGANGAASQRESLLSRRGLGLAPLMNRHPKGRGDVEAADFDENELDDLGGDDDEDEDDQNKGASGKMAVEKENGDMGRERYSLGDVSSDEEGPSALDGRPIGHEK